MFDDRVEPLVANASSTSLASSATVKGFFISLCCSAPSNFDGSNITCHETIGSSGRLAKTTRATSIPFISGIAISTMSSSMSELFSIISICKGAIARSKHAITQTFQARNKKFSHVAIVIGHEDRRVPAGGRRHSLFVCFMVGTGRPAGAWQINSDSGAFAKRRIDPDGTAGLLGNTVHLAQSQSSPAPNRLRRKERFKRFLLYLSSHAKAGIAYRYNNIIATGQFGWTIWLGAISVGGRNGQAAATGHRIPRIDGKVQNDELDLASVDHRRPQSLLKHRLDPNRGPNSSEQKIAHAGNQGIQISWFRLKALSSRKCQQLPRQLGSPLRGLSCAGEISANFVVVSAAACKL